MVLKVLLDGLQVKGGAVAAPINAVGSIIFAGTRGDEHPLLETTSTS